MKDTSLPPIHAVILAAGKGTRMRSATPKVMHKVGGLPMIGHVRRTCESLGVSTLTPVLAPDMAEIAAYMAPHTPAIQSSPKGSGDALKAAMPALAGQRGLVLVLMGDVPLVTTQTLQQLLASATQSGFALLGMRPPSPAGYGRLLVEGNQTVSRIIEDRDATPEQKNITICNAGIYAISLTHLPRWLEALTPDNSQGEYYLTDLVALATRDGIDCRLVIADAAEVQGVNNRQHLADMEALFQSRMRAQAMEGGATLIDPASITFAHDTIIGRDVSIEPHVFFGAGVRIDDGATIHAFSYLEGVHIETGASVGPFARIRPRSVIGAGASVGNFIEVNRTHLGAGAKAKHVSYLGDADIASGANIGAGTVIANYDGTNKHKTTIGEGAFVGSNSTLVAPIHIAPHSYVGAGSTLTRDTEPGALTVARAKAQTIEGWADRQKKKTTKSATKPDGDKA